MKRNEYVRPAAELPENFDSTGNIISEEELLSNINDDEFKEFDEKEADSALDTATNNEKKIKNHVVENNSIENIDSEDTLNVTLVEKTKKKKTKKKKSKKSVKL